MLKDRLGPVLNHSYDLDQPGVPASHREAFESITAITGLPVVRLPQVVCINALAADGRDHYYTLLHNTAHSNISSMFKESSELDPEHDSITVVRNFLGSYPYAYWRVEEKNLPALAAQIKQLSDEASYRALAGRHSVRRMSPEFWSHSDKVMAAHHDVSPFENGLLDCNRLKNR